MFVRAYSWARGERGKGEGEGRVEGEVVKVQEVPRLHHPPRSLLPLQYRCCVDFGPNTFPMGLSLLYEKPPKRDMGVTFALAGALSTDSIVWKFGMLLSLLILAGTANSRHSATTTPASDARRLSA